MLIKRVTYKYFKTTQFISFVNQNEFEKATVSASRRIEITNEIMISMIN